MNSACWDPASSDKQTRNLKDDEENMIIAPCTSKVYGEWLIPSPLLDNFGKEITSGIVIRRHDKVIIKYY